MNIFNIGYFTKKRILFLCECISVLYHFLFHNIKLENKGEGKNITENLKKKHFKKTIVIESTESKFII